MLTYKGRSNKTRLQGEEVRGLFNGILRILLLYYVII